LAEIAEELVRTALADHPEEKTITEPAVRSPSGESFRRDGGAREGARFSASGAPRGRPPAYRRPSRPPGAPAPPSPGPPPPLRSQTNEAYRRSSAIHGFMKLKLAHPMRSTELAKFELRRAATNAVRNFF